MKRYVVITLVLTMLVAIHCLAQKSTIDPNATRPGTAAATPSQPTKYDASKDPDKRMQAKVSYEALHLRLSKVLADLSQASGIPISCGKSKNDWQVRDIPVTLYAKDVPIGTLLRAIARTTHNALKAEKLNDAVIYRVMQDPKMSRQFADYEGAKDTFKKAVVSWNWDCVAGLKDVPDSQLQGYDNNQVVRSLRINSIRKVSALLNALGSDYKQRVMDGEPVILDPQKVPSEIKPAVIGVLSAYDQLKVAYRTQFGGANNWAATQPDMLMPLTADELEQVPLNLSLPDSDNLSLWNSMMITATGKIGLGLPTSAYEYLKPDKKGKRPGPAPPTPPKIDDESAYDIDFPDNFAKTPDTLQKKVDMDDWAQKKGLNYPAVIEEMAKRAGVSVVVEDWDYFKAYQNTPQQWLKKGVTLQEVRYYNYRFRFDPANNLIVLVSNDWIPRHEALAPASVIDPLIDKIKADCIDLDDLLPAMLLTNAQWQEWVQESNDLNIIGRHCSTRDPLWQFFAQLTQEDRAQAATPAGISMGRFDPSVVSELLASVKKFRQRLSYSSYLQNTPDVPDDQTLARLTLRLARSEGQFYSQWGSTPPLPKDKPLPKGLDKTYSYSLYVSGSNGESETHYADGGGPWQLPFYSKDREAELIKSLVDKGRSSPTTATTPTVQGNVIRL